MARERNLAERTALALALGVSTDRLKSYELGNVPLPWTVGNAICHRLNVSQEWLATGRGDLRHFYPIPLPIDAESDAKRGSFGEIFDRHFKPALHQAQGLLMGQLIDIQVELNRSLSDLVVKLKDNPSAWDEKRYEKILRDLHDILKVVQDARAKSKHRPTP